MLLLGIAAESPSNARFVTRLGDRVLVEAADWLAEQDDLDPFRRWRGVRGEAYLDVHRAFEEARRRGVLLHGHFDDSPGKEDARMIRAALALFADEDERPAVVVVSRDTDEEGERIQGFEQARDDPDRRWPFQCVLAAAHPEHEGWLLAAFDPETDQERDTLAELRAELGFDPTRRPHELKSGDESAKRNAKRVLKQLCDGVDAEERLLAVPLARLRERGASCCLTRYLDELFGFAAPALGGRRA